MDDRADHIAKGCALIQANLGINPQALNAEDWAAAVGQAIWLENWRLLRLREMLVGRDQL